MNLNKLQQNLKNVFSCGVGHKKGKKNVGRKKGKQGKTKKVIPQKSKETTGQYKKSEVTTARKKRTKICNSYWLNGLQLSRKPNDERVMLFKEKKRVASSKDFSGSTCSIGDTLKL